MNRIDIGSVEVLVMGVHLPIRHQSFATKQEVAHRIGHLITERLSTQFDGEFTYEIVSIVDGCIKVKLRLYWNIACGNLKEAVYVTAALVSIAAGLKTLASGDSEPDRIIVNQITCEAKFAGHELISGCYIVQPGDTLGEIVEQFKYAPFSRTQAMVAIFNKNPEAFINNNLNLLKSGALLIIPGTDEIRKLGAREADDLYNKHMQSGN